MLGCIYHYLEYFKSMGGRRFCIFVAMLGKGVCVSDRGFMEVVEGYIGMGVPQHAGQRGCTCIWGVWK